MTNHVRHSSSNENQRITRIFEGSGSLGQSHNRDSQVVSTKETGPPERVEIGSIIAGPSQPTPLIFATHMLPMNWSSTPFSILSYGMALKGFIFILNPSPSLRV